MKKSLAWYHGTMNDRTRMVISIALTVALLFQSWDMLTVAAKWSSVNYLVVLFGVICIIWGFASKKAMPFLSAQWLVGAFWMNPHPISVCIAGVCAVVYFTNISHEQPLFDFFLYAVIELGMLMLFWLGPSLFLRV